MQPWAKKLVDHQPGQPGGEQPVDDPALSWPAHGDDDDDIVEVNVQLEWLDHFHFSSEL